MLGGILAGALAGGAKAGEQIADNAIQERTKTRQMELENKLQMERQAQVERLRQSIGREDKLWSTTGEGGKAQLEHTKQLEGVKTDAEVDRETRLGPVKAQNKAAETQAAADVETNVIKKRGSDKDYVDSKQKLTDAGESTSTKSSRAVSTQSQSLDNKIKQEAWKLESERRAALDAGDTARVEQIEKKLRALSNKSDEGYDIVKTITETDPLTAETKTRTEVTTRRPSNAPVKQKPPPKGGAPFAEGARIRDRETGQLFIIKNGEPVPYGGK